MTTPQAVSAVDPRVVLSPQLEVPAAPAKAPRLVSLDVFRGATIAAMILVNNSPDPHYWPLDHSAWNGWTPTDLIFPFFLFIVGVATPFSMSKRATLGDSRGRLLMHIWTRALSLFVLGELLTAIPWVGLSTPPDGFEWIKWMRIGAWTFCCLGVVLLLIPWRSFKVSAVLAPLFLVLLYVLAIASHIVISRTGGLPDGFHWGNGLLHPDHLRIPGVLQRIGICYGIAATLGLYFGWRMVTFWAIAFMVIYSVLMLAVPFPTTQFGSHTVGSLTKEDNLARRVDEWLLIRYKLDDSGKPVIKDGERVERWNHAYSYPDNEGLISTLPSIAEVLLGILAGVWLRTFRPAGERCAGLLVFGVLVLLLGLGLNRWLMPINKDIWTPSFTIFTTGMGLLCLGVAFYFVDVLGYRAWSGPFKVYGMNAIAAFVISGMIVRIASVIHVPIENVKTHAMEHTTAWHWCEHQVNLGLTQLSAALQHLGPTWAAVNSPQNVSLVFGIGYIIIILFLMWLMYLLKIFVKV